MKIGERKGGEHVDSFCFFCFEITPSDPSVHILHDSCSAATIDKYTFFVPEILSQGISGQWMRGNIHISQS